MTSCEQVTDVIKAKLEPERAEQVGLEASVCVYSAGTQWHTKTPGLPTISANYSLVPCSPYEHSQPLMAITVT